MEEIQKFTDDIRELTDDLDHHKAADALGALLSSKANPEDIAKIITMIYKVPPKESSGRRSIDYDGKPYYFWSHHMRGAIINFGGDAIQERRLVDVLDGISNPPDVIQTYPGISTYRDDIPRWWFYHAHSLEFDHARGYRYGNGHRDTQFLAQGPDYLKMTKFSAAVLKTDRASHPLWQEAFGLLHEALGHGYNDTVLDPTLRLNLQILLPAALIWLFVAGKTIHDSCVEEEIGQFDDDSEAHTFDGFGPRWATWTVSLSQLAKSHSLSDQYREWASQGVSRMIEIADGHSD